MIKDAIVKIVDKQDLTYDEAYAVVSEIMSGATTPTQNAAFLAALSTKSTKAETIDEITGCAAAMREAATRFENDLDHFHHFRICYRVIGSSRCQARKPRGVFAQRNCRLSRSARSKHQP